MMRMAGSVSKGWLARKIQVTFGREYYFDVRKRHATDAQCSEYVARELVDLDVFHTESNLGRRQWYSPRQVLVGGIQPNMIVGMLMGAEFIPRSDADADISPRCLAALDVGQLPAPASLLEHPLIRLWLDQIQEVRGWQEGDMQPIPPFFWDASGRAAVHGAVTSGLKFYGDEFLMELLTQPAESTVVVDWLTDVSAALVAQLRRRGPDAGWRNSRWRVCGMHDRRGELPPLCGPDRVAVGRAFWGGPTAQLRPERPYPGGLPRDHWSGLFGRGRRDLRRQDPAGVRTRAAGGHRPLG